MKSSFLSHPPFLAWLLVIGAGIIGYGAYEHRALGNELARSELQGQELAAQLANERAQNRTLSDTNASFAGTIASITTTVDTLEKLSKTDKELLQKYSKVYFLNENYVPSSLSPVSPDYVYDRAKDSYIHSGVKPFLERMLTAARNEGIMIQIVSAYRSFESQKSLKNEYAVVYGSGANSFSADQGYSEHQLGTTVDLTTPKIGTTFSGFSKTDAYAWLTAHAWEYGFILSYPPKNAYYQYEPWHWRFVGLALAKKLHDEGKYFYDLDQRDIDSYLVSFFDER